MTEVLELAGHRCLVAGEGDEIVCTVRDAIDLIGEALSEGATGIVVPASHLDAAFFQLRSGLAGEVLQKAANYHLKFAVIGDVSEHIASSDAFRDLVVESQRSQTFFFEPDLDALRERLSRIPANA